MVKWSDFTPSDFESDKLAAHGITFDEAVECFFSDFEVRRTNLTETVTNSPDAPSAVAA